MAPPDVPGTVVPGVTTGTTPPFLQPQAGPGSTDDMTKRMLEMIMRSAQQRRFAGQPRPMPVPGRMDPNQPPDYMTSGPNPHAWGAQRLMYGIQSMMRNAVSQHKEQQINKATADWEYAQAALNEYYQAQSSGDQASVATAQKKLDVVFGDPKKLKNMAKALNQDWLNPEKTTVYGEALKRTLQKTQQGDQAKQQARGGIMNMFRKLIGKGQPQAQLTPDEKTRMEQEIIEKAPTTTGTGGMDLKSATEIATIYKDLRSSPEKYEIKPVRRADGSEVLMAVDKSDPTKPAIEVKSKTGEELKPVAKQFPNEGKLETIGGIPTGRVMHKGQYVAPGKPGYTKEDTEAVNLGLNAQNLSEKQKEKLAAIRGEVFAKSRATYTAIPVTDNETGEAGYARMIDVAMNPGKYVQPGESEKIAARDAVHRSLKANFSALDKDLAALPNGLDLETQATVAAAMRSETPGMFETLLVNAIKKNSPDEVIRYITDMKAMQEDILVLRSVGGMGAGSDMMRAAMVRLIPGPGSSSIKEARMQMGAAQRTSESLFTGRPEAGFSRRATEAGAGDMERQVHNGVIYERKRGSKDPWKKVPKPE